MKDEDVDQLVQNESFLNYVFGRKVEDVTYWEDWLRLHPEHMEEVMGLKQRLINIAQVSEEKVVTQDFVNLHERIKEAKKVKKRAIPLWPRMVAAAAAILLIAFGSYWLLDNKNNGDPLITNVVKADIQPGGNKAVLTLSGGKQVILTGAGNGIVASQGGIRINKTAEGSIEYARDGKPMGTGHNASAMNTITTPRGGKWFVTLSDGTKVWLNAASSISYPAAFAGKERKVTITGEAYFEVVHNEKWPFKVVAGNQVVEDIGTAFNVKAYTDEPDIKTTLIEGSVKVSNPYGAAVLLPGYQAKSITEENGGRIQVGKAKDLEQALAWKNDLFIFNRTDLHTLMREISRWYDVDIVYEKGVKNDVFYGRVLRENQLSQVLKVLELGDVHFKIEGKRLIVMP